MKEIVIIGAGDFGKEVAWLIEDINRAKPTYILLGFLDDDRAKWKTKFGGYEVLGPVENLELLNQNHHASAVVAIRDSAIRENIVKSLSHFDAWETLIHPSANKSYTSTVGKGTIICAGANISVDCAVGDQCILNVNTSVENDCEIQDYASLMPGAVIGSRSIVGRHTQVGANSTVDNSLHIGDGAEIGPSSAVLSDVEDNSVVFGVPAKPCRRELWR